MQKIVFENQQQAPSEEGKKILVSVKQKNSESEGHFAVVCIVTWTINTSKAGCDLALIQTSLLFSFKFQLHVQ